MKLICWENIYPALKATDFNSSSILFELKNRYHEDLNGILKGDLEWAKYYIALR